VKFTLNILERSDDQERHWPGYVLGGRVRTSTLVLIVAFFALLWVYVSHQEGTSSSKVTTVVPPPPKGYVHDTKNTDVYVPDPNYTMVPRTTSEQPPPPTTPTTTPPVITTTTPPFVLPTLPCIPPFCTPSTTPTTPPLQQPSPGLGPAPTSTPPAR
jgi:hypothetical protein